MYPSLKIFSSNVDKTNQIINLYLLLTESGQPIKLGEGRFARVFLGSTNATPTPSSVLAIKFLKRDKSETVTRNARARFLEEIRQFFGATGVGKTTGIIGFRGFGLSQTANELRNDLMLDADYYCQSNDGGEGWSGAVFANSSGDVDATFMANSQTLRSSNLVNTFEWLTGDFYAMDLAICSLDELLVYPPSEETSLSLKRAYEEFPKIKSQAFDRYLDPNVSVGKSELKAVSGFALLSNPIHDTDRTYLQLRIFHGCLVGVGVLHSEWQDSKPTAHRDIKPGNILIKPSEQLDPIFALSDLGYAASADEIAEGSNTQLTSLKEGGRVAVGSKGFRSPEQLNFSENTVFTLSKEDGSSESCWAVQFTSQFNEEPNDGDWLIAESRAGEARSRIWRDKDSRKWFLGSALGEENEFLGPTFGYIVRDIGTATDVFSLGLLLYFLASEGKNPEDFIVNTLLVAQRCVAANMPQEKKINCQMIAAILSHPDDKDANEIVKAVQEVGQNWLERAREFANSFFSRSPKNQPAEFRKLDFLSSRLSLNPIPFAILSIICRCCIRDLIDSYSASGSVRPDAIKPAEPILTGVPAIQRDVNEALLKLNQSRTDGIVGEFCGKAVASRL